jgi:hypothetical protein
MNYVSIDKIEHISGGTPEDIATVSASIILGTVALVGMTRLFAYYSRMAPYNEAYNAGYNLGYAQAPVSYVVTTLGLAEGIETGYDHEMARILEQRRNSGPVVTGAEIPTVYAVPI